MNELYERLQAAKLAEYMAKLDRLEIEREVIESFGETKPEGATTKTDGYYKVTLTNKLTRSLNFEAYQRVPIPENLQFVDLKPVINLKKLRMVEAVDPNLVASCVTVKPAKASVKIEEVAP